MKNYIKVLPLPFWASGKEGIKTGYLRCVGQEIKPVFNRYGLYLDRKEKKCWIESPFGCNDYQKGYNQFLYDISLLNHRPLTEIEQNAIRILIMSKIADKTIKRLFYMDTVWFKSRQTYRDSRKFLIKILNERKETG